MLGLRNQGFLSLVVACFAFVGVSASVMSNRAVETGASDTAPVEWAVSMPKLGIGSTRGEVQKRQRLRPTEVSIFCRGSTRAIRIDYVWVEAIGDDVVRAIVLRPVASISLTEVREVAQTCIPPDARLLDRLAPVETRAKNGVDRYVSESLSARLMASGNLSATRLDVTYGVTPGGIDEIGIFAHP